MDEKEPRCIKCQHFYVTYDKAFPRGCRIFNLQCKTMPSKAVYRSSGHHCPSFQQRPPAPKK